MANTSLMTLATELPYSVFSLTMAIEPIFWPALPCSLRNAE